MIALEQQGLGLNRANVISADGEVIGGFTKDGAPRTPAAWLASTGLAHPTFPYNSSAGGEISAASSDGRVLAGSYIDSQLLPDLGLYDLPFYWTQEEGIVILPSVPGFNGGMVLGVSDDNRTWVGYGGTILTGLTAAVWRREWGGVDLKSKLIELGASVPDGFFPQYARAVTTDGRTVVGWGSGPEVGTRAFVATLPPPEILPCPADLNGDGTVGFADLTQLLGAWGPCPGCDEDLDESGQVGFSDLTILLNNWAPCP